MIRNLGYMLVYLITETVLCSLAYCTIFNRKITKRFTQWIVYIMVMTAIHGVIYQNSNLELVMGITMFTMVIVPCLIIEPFKIQNIVIYPFVIISASIFGVMFSFLISAIIGKSEQYIVESPFYTIVCQILCILVWGLIYYIKRRQGDIDEINLNFRHYIILYAVAVSAILIISSIQYFSKLIVYENVQIYSLFVVMACTTLVVVTLIQIVVLSQNAKIKKSNDIYRDFIAMQKQHYEQMLLQYEELRKFRHDVKNHMLVIDGMCTDEDNANIKQYLEDMRSKISAKEIIEYTGNRELDIIITPFIREAEKKKIKVKFEGGVSSDLKVDMFDMCTIISNLLSNATEACEKIEEEKRIIEIKIANYNSQIFIEVRNSCDNNSCKKLKDCFITSKADRINHGIGMENIRRTVEKYGGLMRISQKEDNFIVTINM